MILPQSHACTNSHFVCRTGGLYDTGRWRHYYTQAELVAALQEAIRVRDQWARIAGLLPEDEAADAAEKPARRMNGR